MAATIKDVAERAGVSSATVSRVMSGKPHVREELRRRVLAAVDELNYQPSRVARSLRVRSAKIIGLVISDIQNPFFTALVRAVEDVASEHGFALLLCNADEDSAKEKLYVELMQGEQVSGVMFSTTSESGGAYADLLAHGVPLVAVDRTTMDLPVDTVVVDNARGVHALVSHLIEDGHRRIGAVLGDPTVSTGRERRAGYVRALRDHGLPVRPELLRCGPPVQPAGRRLTAELLSLPEPPTAVLTGNNLLTAGALGALRERGLRIPDDVGVAAFDDLDWMSLVQPAVTVAAQPTYELGRTAAELLLRRIDDPSRPPRTVVFNPTVVVRGSCGRHGSPAPAAPDPDAAVTPR